MSVLLDCLEVGSIEVIDETLVFPQPVLVEPVYLESDDGARFPGLEGIWVDDPNNPYIAGLQYQYEPLDDSAGRVQGTATAADESWISSSGVVPGRTYRVRTRAVGVAPSTFGPWSEWDVVTAPNEYVASDTVNVGGRAASDVLLSIDDLIATYGDTASASASAAAAAAAADAADDARAAALQHRNDAEGQANLASGYATSSESFRNQAQGFASASSGSAVAAQAARDTVIRVGRNGDFSAGKLGWEDYGLTVYYASAGGWSNILETGLGISGTLLGSPVDIAPGDVRYRLDTRFRQVAGNGIVYYQGVLFYDGADNLIAASDGTGNYPLAVAITVNVDEVISRSVIIGRGGTVPASPYGGTATIPAGAARFRPIWYYNYSNLPGARAWIDYFTVTDVTSEQASGGYASAAQGSAAQASASAAAASTSANLAATVSTASILQNSRFTDWSALTGSGFPQPWGTADSYLSGGSSVAKVSGELPGTYGLKFIMPAGSGVQAYGAQITEPGTITPGGWYVVESDFRVDAGSPLGAGVYFVITDADGSGLSAHVIEFYADPDNNTGAAIANGVVGRVYRFSKLVQITTAANASRTRTYSMGRWTGFGQGVSNAYGEITFLKTAVRPATGQEIETQKARDVYPSLSARISDVSSVAAAATAAVASRTTTLEARTSGTSPNLITNPSGNDGLVGWDSLGSRPWLTYPDLTWGQWFSARLDGEAAASATLRSMPISPAGYGYVYTLQGQVFLSGYTGGGYVDLGVYGYTDAEGTTGEHRMGGHGITAYGLSPGRVILPPLTVASLPQTRSIRIWFQSTGTNWAGYAHVGFWGLKLEQGSVATTFSDDASTRVAFAKITEARSVLASLEGRVEATAGLTVQAGNRIAGMRFHAVDGTDVNYSSIDFLADVFRVWDSINQTGVAPFEIRNGGVRARAAVIDRLSVTVKLTLGSGIPWAVAVQPLDLSVTDGQVVNFGYDLGNNPTLTFAGNNLVPLNSGETYNLYADNLSPTGFIARLKINTPGTPANVSLGPTNGSVSGPTSHHLYLGAVSTTGSYDVRVTGTVRSYFYNAYPNSDVPIVDGDGGSYTDGELYIYVYGYSGGVWSQIDTIYVFPSIRQGGSVWSGGSPTGYYDDAFDITQAVSASSNVTYIGAAVGYETYSQSNLYSLAITFQGAGTAAGVRSATPNGQLSTVTVRPRT